MTIRGFGFTLATALMLAIPAGAAPTQPTDDGWGRNSAYNQKFDPKAMVTVSGTVEKVNRDSHPLAGMAPGFSMQVKTDKGEHLEAQIGPKWFTEFYHHKWNVQPGDRFTLTGSKVNIGGHPVVMVVQGSKGNLKATVRNKSGVPIWDLEMEDF